MRYMLHMTRKLADGGEEGFVGEIDPTQENLADDTEKHYDLVSKHLIRDGWDEVTFKKDDVTKRLYKEDD